MISGSVEPAALLIENVRADPEFSSHAAAELSPQVGSFIGVPVVLSGGAFYGTLCAVDPEPQKVLTRQQADLMAVLARLLATQIEHQRAEEALRENQEVLHKSEEFHRFAVEAGRIGTWDLDLRTEDCLISPKMAELMGFPPDQTTVPGSRWREAIVTDDRASMASALAASTESDAPFDLEFRIALKDGTERWLYSRGGVSRDASGRALRVHGTSIDITERKRAEEAIRESSRRIENILESIAEEFFAVDREWRYTYINERALRRIRRAKGGRLTREELLGRNVWEVYPELVGSVVYRELHRALREQKRTEFEALSPLSHRWFELHAYPSDEGLAVYGQDITERKLAGEALRESEERFRSAFESAAIGIALMGLDGRWLEVNEPMCEFLGYPREELLRTDFQELTHPDDLHDDLENLHRLLAGEIRSYQMEKRYIHKKGHVICGLLSASLVRDAEGAPLYALAQVQDITQSKHHKEVLERLHLQNESILKSAGEGIFGLDRRGRVTLANPAGTRMIGYEPEELIGCRMHDVVHHTRPDGTPYPSEECPIYTAFEDGLVHTNADEVFWRKDGSSFPVEYTSTPMEVDGNVIGAVVTFRDITERKRFEEALAREVRAKSDFLADASHELRTPLTVIRGNAEVGLELGRGWAHADLLEEIVKESGMMSRMVEDLLFLARSDADSLPLDLRTVPVARLTGGLARRAEALAREHGASLKTALSGDGILRCDPGRIEEAVLVLIDNAAKYGPPGGQVTLSSSTSTGVLQIEVADQGPGISEDELPRVFERFYRCKNSHGKQGSGLGLPIAKTIVEGHGGRIEAESEAGEGTRVALRLPLMDRV